MVVWKNSRFVAACLVVLFSIVAWQTSQADDAVNIDDLAWLSGEWIGDGRSGEEGMPEGVARIYWSPVLEGALASTFTWHIDESDHVHYAFSTFRQVDDGVEGAGIHYTPEFENFEQAAWQWRAKETSAQHFALECVAHCRAKSVVYTLKEDGSLEGRWVPIEDGQPLWITRYRRVQ